MYKIITIGREFSSGGREYGRRLAEELGFDYIDKEIINEISKRTELSEEYVRSIVEKRPHSLYPITVGHSLVSMGSGQVMAQEQSVYKEQHDIIASMAEKSNCVIVGRCADYILRDLKPFRIFIYADMESRIKRCIERDSTPDDMDEKRAIKLIKKLDKNRSKYYEFYTGNEWGDITNYDMMINTSGIDIKKHVKFMAQYIREMMNQEEK